MDFTLGLNEFLQKIEDGNLRKIEAYSYIDSITDNFRIDKLKVLLEDINDAIEERRSHYRETWEELVPSLKPRYNEQGEQIPKRWKRSGKVYDLQEELDFVLMVQLHNLQTLKEVVLSKIEEHDDKKCSNVAMPTLSHSIPEVGIEQFLNDEGLKHFEVIKKLYQQTPKKKEYVIMLFALGKLGFLNTHPLTVGKTAYHKALVATFGEVNVGKRANVDHYLRDIEDPISQEQIKRHVILIKNSIQQA